jgi:hypothetical protein
MINGLSKILDVTVRRMLYYGFIYLLLAYGIVILEQTAKALTRQICTLQKRALRYTAELNQLESCRDSFRQLNGYNLLDIKFSYGCRC